jgi:iron complex outermembrane recepter protein
MSIRTSGNPLPARSPFNSVRLAVSAALSLGLAWVVPQPAHAQSTGTTAAEELTEVVVTARRGLQAIGGVTEQNAAKSRVSITGEFLEKAFGGQTVIESLNQVPGVNFTNNDPYGSSGGNLRLRGFDGSRVSLTFDGIPLNDTGNYASFTNQLPDTEIIEQVDVNLGTTDVDSPTASATGGTIAWRTRKPSQAMGGLAVLSVGENNYRRLFGRLDSGAIGPWGTTAFIAASATSYDKFRGPGDLNKKQVNARIQQDFDNGNFVALSLHYNRNRNNQYRNAAAATFDANGREYDWDATCVRPAPAAGTVQNDGAGVANNCGNYYNVRLNPSDTGNIRINSLFHLTEKLRLSIDPSFQYTLANGGGSTTVSETPAAGNADRRVVGTTALAGWDLNGDGDILDTVRFYTPNNTNTKRYGLNSSLIWDIADDHRVRFAYTLDYGKHRQTAAWGYLDLNGNPEDVFAGRLGTKVPTADGSYLRGRDRYSIASLNQFAAEYRGQFFDRSVTATFGLRAPYFKRELNQYCYTPNGGSGNSGATGALCTTQVPSVTLTNGNVRFSTSTVEYIPPYKDTIKFDKILPNVGLNWQFTEGHTLYVSYAAGLSAPRTDNLYPVRRQADGSIGRGIPESETTNSYDLGWRFKSDNLLASVALWKVDYSNRIVSAYDQDLGFSVDRNLGAVKIRGLDAQVGWRPVEKLTLNASASFNDSEVQNDTPGTSSTSAPILTRGKKLVEVPDWTFGLRADLRATEALTFGLQGKYVGRRFGTDNNDAYAPAYRVFDLDARYSFEVQGLKQLSVQLNVSNLFDEKYYGSISSGTGGTNLPFYQLGAPRTAMISVRAAF